MTRPLQLSVQNGHMSVFTVQPVQEISLDFVHISPAGSPVSPLFLLFVAQTQTERAVVAEWL